MKRLGLIFLVLIVHFTSIAQLQAIGRSQHAACFDSKKGEMLVFGGSKQYNKEDTTEKADNKLWAWNNGEWKILSESGPTWREDAKMVYHEMYNKTYLLGGRNYDANGKAIVLNEFWEWNDNTWRLISNSNPMGKRLHTNMIYDSERNRIVLFGGVDIEKGFTNDIWEWDGKDWTKINTVNAPTRRIAHSMTYSKYLNKTIIAGGVSDKDEKLMDLWTWDGKQFAKINTKMPAIEPGSGNIVSYGRDILIFGRPLKAEENAKNGSTWLYDGKNWKKINPLIAPSVRENHIMVYDIQKNKVLLFGGNGREEVNFENDDDVWEWEKNKWKNVNK
jgi:hypothetical protein